MRIKEQGTHLTLHEHDDDDDDDFKILICAYVDVIINFNCLSVCLFSWRYNPSWLYFHSPLAGFSLLVFEVS